MTLLASEHGAERCSESIAQSIGVNPVVVRTIISKLRKAGLLATRQGVAGAMLELPADKITLLDIYKAIEDSPEIFGLHEKTDTKCPVGNCIQPALQEVFCEARRAMEARLGQTTLAEFIRDLEQRAAKAMASR